MTAKDGGRKQRVVPDSAAFERGYIAGYQAGYLAAALPAVEKRLKKLEGQE